MKPISFLILILLCSLIVGCDAEERREKQYLTCNDYFIAVANKYWELESEKGYWESLKLRAAIDNNIQSQVFYQSMIDSLTNEQRKNTDERQYVRDSCHKIICNFKDDHEK